MEGVWRQQAFIAVCASKASIGSADFTVGIADEVDHHFCVVVQLDAEPVPATAAKGEEVAPLVIHPGFASHL